MAISYLFTRRKTEVDIFRPHEIINVMVANYCKANQITDDGKTADLLTGLLTKFSSAINGMSKTELNELFADIELCFMTKKNRQGFLCSKDKILGLNMLMLDIVVTKLSIAMKRYSP